MLSALLKKQLQEIFRSYFYNAKQGKARSRVSTVGYFAFFAVLTLLILADGADVTVRQVLAHGAQVDRLPRLEGGEISS